MKLYLLRHGHAEPGGNGIDDRERQLTDEGVQRMTTAAAVMAKLELCPKFIFSSPRVRARQTAEIVAEALNMTIDIRDEVNFDFSVDKIKSLTTQMDDSEDAMFVGHEPSMSLVVEALTGGEVEMKKGGLAMIEVVSREPFEGVLVWLIAPKVFDTLA